MAEYEYGGYLFTGTEAEIAELKRWISLGPKTWRAILEEAGLDVNDSAIEYLRIDLAILSDNWRYDYQKDADRRRNEERRKNELERIRAAATELAELLSKGTVWRLLPRLTRTQFLLPYPPRRRIDPPELVAMMGVLIDGLNQVEIEHKGLFDSQEIRSAKKARGENPQTRLFLRLRDLYMKLGGSSEIGSGGPLYRFVSACVDVIGGDISVPSKESFRLLMVKALKRRRGIARDL
jgi:hypothetical protein